MRCDTVAANMSDDFGRADGVRMVASPRVADGGDMVDIDPEAQRGRHAAIRLPGFTAGMLARSEGTSSAAYVGKFSWIRG